MVFEEFLLKKGLEGQAMHGVAEKFFGPRQTFQESNSQIQIGWHFRNGDEHMILDIVQKNTKSRPWSRVEINGEIHISDLDKSEENPIDFSKKISQFICEVKQPWAEWSESEMLEDPMWIYLYQKDGNLPSKAMHSKMAMESFLDASNTWVKRYFSQNFVIP